MEKPYFLVSSSKTLHIKNGCPSVKGIQPNMGEHFRTESEVWKKEGLTFKWCQNCLDWREKVIQKALQQEEEK